MSKLVKQSIHFDDGSVVETFRLRQYYRHKGDREILGRLRSCAANPGPNTNGGCPAVWVLQDEENMVLNKYWQFALCGWNPRMPPAEVMNKLGNGEALSNGTGYGKEGRNLTCWPTGSHTDSPYNPAFDKDRTCSMSMLSGVAVPNGKVLFKDYRTENRRWYTGYLIVDTFDGTINPPLKPGFKQPETISEVNFEHYLHNPRDHWSFFFALNIITQQEKLIPFPKGATYPWFFESRHPVCFMPHVSRKEILYPLDLLEKLPLGTQRVKPYIQ